MKTIVQKFGGKSLNTAEKREKAAFLIKKAREDDFSPLVVVSAMGRLGEPYATDTLIDLAVDICNEFNEREKDLLMSCGEVISTVIMVQTLKKYNIKAIALTGGQAGIITDDKFGKAKILKVKPDYLLSLLKKGMVPVIAGFQGITENGQFTTIGRGGSDTTASIIAAAVSASFIEIYSDVKGVMTADPFKVNEASLLKEISYNEACELAYQGARVIHPRAAEIAMKNEIPIKVKSLMDFGSGTIIHKNVVKSDRPVNAVTSRNNIIFVTVYPDKPAEYVTGLKIFDYLAEAEISVDFINVRPAAISFVIIDELKDRMLAILKDNKFNYKISENLVKLSVVGGGMTGQPGIMSKIAGSLTKAGVSIYQTTDSHTTISCLIECKLERKALNVLHSSFALEDSQSK